MPTRAGTVAIRLHVWMLIVAVVACVGAFCALGIRQALGPAPTLDDVRSLAQRRRYRQAQMLLAQYLPTHPQNARAHLLMAQLATEPTNVQPDLALGALAKIHPETTKQAALIKFFEGKARFQQKRYDLAEACWTEALRLDLIVPEAGWALVDLLDKEGRNAAAHSLGMRLHEVEPDPVDRVKILLEMTRLDFEFPDPLSQVELFEPLVRQHPEHLPLSLTVGLALVRCNRSDEGLQILRSALDRHPSSPEAWDAWLTGLYDASEADKLAAEFGRLPRELAADGRFAKHEGIIAQIARNWPKAVVAYRRAFAYEPFNWGVCYKYRFALRQAGDTAEFRRIHQLYETYREAYKQVRGSYFERFEPGTRVANQDESADAQRGAYYETLAIKTLGWKPYPALYQRLATLREQMGRFDEARAWHRLVLRDSPDDPISLSALERLK
jgi:tetratricopeptide (TPR) repeat protein